MTRERAKELLPIIQAFSNGETIEWHNVNLHEWRVLTTPAFDDDFEYRIKPEQKKRPMTRGEVLYMVTTTPSMVVEECVNGTIFGNEPTPALFVMFKNSIFDNFRYAIIDQSGEPIDGWHKFEVEVF